ncbi:hotdog fold thioesterase [Alicyclobacillus acidocaldarius]|nr:hotdog fold thioesterase [Alicyclobacillus acidocaldarius]
MDIRELIPNTLMAYLGMEVVEASKERIVMTMPVDARTHQPMGLLHGGASVALAESAASLGGALNVCDDGKVVVGMEINANHIRPLREGVVKAIAEPIHRGSSTQVWQIRIVDERDRLVCISRCTLAVIQNRGRMQKAWPTEV